MEDSFSMKNGGAHIGRCGRDWMALWGVVMCLGAAVIFSPAGAAEEEGEKKQKSTGSSLGDLLNGLKDMKVPDSVSKFPEQLKELKDAYLKTTKTVEDLQKEVTALRQEVKILRDEQSQLKEGLPGETASGGVGSPMEIQQVTAEELVSAFAEDNRSAKQQFEGKYLKVQGAIQEFQTGNQQIVIFLRAKTSDSRVKCNFKRDDNFHVEVVASQGRLVSRNDRTTLLTIGQPVTIIGTCTGSTIDVTMVNCHMEGIDSKRKPESK